MDKSTAVLHYVQEYLVDPAVSNYLETANPASGYAYLIQRGMYNLCDIFTNKFTDTSPCHCNITL